MDETDGDIEEPSPSCGDYVMHFLTLFWKILFAFIPPTGNLPYIVYNLNTELLTTRIELKQQQKNPHINLHVLRIQRTK